MLFFLLYIFIFGCNLIETHKAPPPAGPKALKNDMSVMAIPFAAPLWSWSCHIFIRSFKSILCRLSTNTDGSRITTALFCNMKSPVSIEICFKFNKHAIRIQLKLIHMLYYIARLLRTDRTFFSRDAAFNTTTSVIPDSMAM